MNRFMPLPPVGFRQTRLAIAAVLLCAMAGAASAQSVWELTPYRVRLILALSPTAELNSVAASGLKQSLCDRVESVVGARWDMTVLEPSPGLRHRLLADLGSVRFEDLPKDTEQFDKVMLAAIVSGPTGYQVIARELDVRTRSWSPIIHLPLWQTAKLRDTVLQAMFDCFTPLAQVVSTVKKEVTLRLRAANLPARDPSLLTTRPRDVFQPLIRYNNRQGELIKVQPVPWTFLVVDRCEPDVVISTFYSAMLNPMSGRFRGRVESLALAVRPSGNSTQLKLRGRVEPKPPLADYYIYEQELNSKKTALIGRTDVEGALTIGQGSFPLRLLVVKSGKALLARLPVVPGLTSEAMAEIRNDDQRLEVEGFISALQLNLLEQVTRRIILLKRGRDFIASGDLAKANKLVAELRTLPTREDFVRQLDNQQERILVEDSWTKKKVDELFSDTQKLLAKHLAPEPVEDFAREVAAAERQRQGGASPKKPPRK